ncbi:3-methyladenine DNA glycosylase AlkC [Poseidonocella pacifica]|uniref:3-methyladenine DNA glycosylase AlkC n=1 Tax=Poseidonocella pacifica TaxID=871651 RepID=A0A1I0V8K4_9RHOB|nr:DNA alkylation repair protein [Poseidonocella pacifica]SFA72367.1 3-methyladenine DNA glycosylase AlkC [Poseidonocella pacifica]
MARGKGEGGSAGFSLKDHLFNEVSLAELAAEYSVLPNFDADRFLAEVVPGLAERGLLERLEWIADAIERQLPKGFPALAEALEAAMPPPLDSARTDDDFGRFVHAVPGILAVRRGLEEHRERALDLLHSATQRFSMEFYIRPFLNRWPAETLSRLTLWAEDENYHVRRLVSEGTRPKLPWAKGLTTDPRLPLPLLDRLHADPTRYVTRSVANHLNDLSKTLPEEVLAHLAQWRGAGLQEGRELDWMTRHALRTAVRRGEPDALAMLGYRADAEVDVMLHLPTSARIGEALLLALDLTSPEDLPVLVDYRISFHRPNGRAGEKVFKMKEARLRAGEVLRMEKRHRLKGDATTFRLHPGPHRITIQVNGTDRAAGVVEFQD